MTAKPYYISVIIIVLLSFVSCKDKSIQEFENQSQIYLIGTSATINAYSEIQNNQKLIVSVSPKPISKESLTGEIVIYNESKEFNEFVNAELLNPNFILNEKNNFTDTLILQISISQNLPEGKLPSFSTRFELSPDKNINVVESHFNILVEPRWKRPMNLRDLKKGQLIKYVFLQGSNYAAEDDFFYTGDTLILEVLEVKENGYLISERITDGSNMKRENNDYYDWWGDKNEVHLNYWIVSSDSLIFESSAGHLRSHFLAHDHINGSSDFPYPNLNLKEFDREEIEITGWRTSVPYMERDSMFFTRNYSLFDYEYERLNVAIYNRQLGSDGFGYTYVYNTEEGIIKSSRYLFFTKSGIGWDKL